MRKCFYASSSASQLHPCVSTTFILTLVLFFSMVQYDAFCQNNVIIYKDGAIKVPDEVPYGQIILLNGESKAAVTTVSVECLVMTETNKYTVEKSTPTTWTAKIGPFPVKADVILTIKETRKLSEQEQQQIQTLLTDFITQLKATGSFTPDQLHSALYAKLHELDYRDKNGKPIDSIFMTKVDLSLINKLNDGTKLMSTPLVQLIQKFPASELAKKLTKNEITMLAAFANPTDSLTQAISTTTSIKQEDIKSLLDIYKGLYDKFKEGEVAINTLSQDFFSSISISSSFRSQIDVSGLQAYVGVDLGLIRFDTVTSFFVTLHPYLKKTDPDKDYSLKTSSIWHFITPSLGLGIGGDIGKIKPVYFVGVGFRLNKVFRLAVGGTYFKPPKDRYEKWNLGVSASININYVADLLRLITAAQSQIK